MHNVSRRGLIAAGALAMPALISLPRPLIAQTGTNKTNDLETGKGLPAAAPIHVRKVGLRARDAGQLAEWYGAVLGLEVLAETGNSLALGTAGHVLLQIEGDAGLTLSQPKDAGLYHTAFLLPSRRDLAHWAGHAIQNQIPVVGAADHLVSEAVYLTDPEGNGVEIYADRAPSTWRWQGGQVEMGTEALDVENLLTLAPAMVPPLYRPPAGLMIGHVHLRVGDAARAAQWWQDSLPFDLVRARQGAAFLSTGGYHHHIAVNEWESAGAGSIEPAMTGLAYIELASRPPIAATSLIDPWGIALRLVAES